MKNFDASLRHVIPVLKAGNVLVPLRFYRESLTNASRGDKRCIYDELRRILETYGKDLSGSGVQHAVSLLDSFSEDGDLEQYRSDLVDRMKRLKPANSESAIGMANVLLVSTVRFQEQMFGAAHTLEVRTTGWGGDIRLSSPW